MPGSFGRKAEKANRYDPIMQLQEKALLAYLGVGSPARVWHNLSPSVLFEHAVRRNEASVVASGALSAETGQHTGRSPLDKFFVEEPTSRDRIWWHPGNQPIEQWSFQRLLARIQAFIAEREVFVQDLNACADPRYRLNVRVITELAWHSLFAHQLLRRPELEELGHFEPDFTVISIPSISADPAADGTRSETFVLLDLGRRLALIGGTRYAGEIKKSIFTVLNYLLPAQAVLPMHCSANVGKHGDTALFFGLSGTGKTTLSSDPTRQLIGDDEHGWSEQGVFNFEGGCYAKTIRLSPQSEPEIWAATNRFGSVLENVTFDLDTRETKYEDDSLTENTRAAYPLEAIPGVDRSGRGTHPRNILFLSYDVFGVLPPVAKLDEAQARYFFLSGYTSKVGGTERGLKAPEPVFSTCFSAPFLPLPPATYADLLVERIHQHQTQVWMLNTGLIGGPSGQGSRIPLHHTRAIVQAVVEGRLNGVEATVDPVFGFLIPTQVPGVPSELLDPRGAWADPEAYDRQASHLKSMFDENIERIGHGGSGAG
jgi:phosphoenolpyruvate carboxykinase (ATP)